MTRVKKLLNFFRHHQEVVVVSLILLLATFFRFYKLSSLQYWSTDDEIFSAVVTRMIFDHKITLVSPNATLGVSLGSFFHIFSILPYLLANLDAVKILAFGSLLGIATTALLYLTGRELAGKRVGFFAAFLNSVSFLVVFTDRRWWPLTPDPFFVSLAIFSLIKLARGRLVFSLPLVVSASFAWHSDPTLLVVSVAIILAFFFLRLPLLSKKYLLAITYFCLSISPFVFFELRHPGAISYPVVHLITKSHTVAHSNRFEALLRNDVAGNFGRALFVTPSDSVEEYLLYCETCRQPPLGVVTRMIALIFLVAPLLLWKSNPKIRAVYCIIGAFLIGAVIFTMFYGQSIYLHFYVVVWPAFFLLAAVTLDLLWKDRIKFLVILFLVFVFTSNLNSLTSSRMRYPLKDKLAAANFGIEFVGKEPFSLEIDVDQRRLDGMGGLFFLKGVYPRNASYYEGWNWIYQAYSLYGAPVEKVDPQKTIVISPSSDITRRSSVSARHFGNIKVSVVK